MALTNLLTPPLPQNSIPRNGDNLKFIKELRLEFKREFSRETKPTLIQELRDGLSRRISYGGLPRDKGERENEMVIDGLLSAVEPFIMGSSYQAFLCRQLINPMQHQYH